MFLYTLIIILLVTIYLYVKHCHAYWKKQKIPTLEPTFLVGNMYEAILGKKNFIESVIESYNKFKDYKYVGFYKCLSPTLIINDPEIIGRVLVKDFSHFADNTIHISEEADVLMAKNLFVLKGQHWKSIKSLMTPMFTSGKLKLVFPSISESSDKLVKHLNKRVAEGRNYGIDGKYLTHQFTTENVANCAFGINANAFESEKSEFVDVARAFGMPSFIQSLKINLIFMIPTLGKIFSLSFFTKYVQNYLIDIVSQTMRYRSENNITRNDFLDMISQLKEKSKEFKFDDRDVAAQAAGFFGDGIETSSIVLSYSIYEIAAHPDVQTQLREEIIDVTQRHNGEVTYEALMEMNYLDCVISESMRLNVPLMVSFKTCTKTYHLPPPMESISGVTLHPGDSILIPIAGLHSDERYYPDADKFQPERFDNENKQNLHNYTYLPFGEGPRVCVGWRFGILQIKAAIVHIVMNFHVKVGKKMEVPLKLDPNTFLRMPVGGFWFDFEKIKLKQ